MTPPPSRRPWSPADMPKRRRPEVPIRPRPEASSPPKFVVARDIPRRGAPDATVWPDTGVLLTLGTAEDLPARFASTYRGRSRVPRKVENELRGHSLGGGDSDADRLKTEAARVVVDALFVGERRFPAPELEDTDMSFVEAITTALRKFPGGEGKKHGGEAVVIALAVKERNARGTRQLLLANDAGASVVAANNGIATRHAADVLAEMACADHSLTPERCLSAFQDACEFSAPPRDCRPSATDAFRCRRASEACALCDPR